MSPPFFTTLGVCWFWFSRKFCRLQIFLTWWKFFLMWWNQMELEFIWKDINTFFFKKKKKAYIFCFLLNLTLSPSGLIISPFLVTGIIKTHNIEDCCLSGTTPFQLLTRERLWPLLQAWGGLFNQLLLVVALMCCQRTLSCWRPQDMVSVTAGSEW